MKKITTLLILCLFSLSTVQMYAQEEEKEKNEEQIEKLKSQKEEIEADERKRLMEEVEAINERLDKGEISLEEANKLKKEAATRRALNIENRLAIIDNKIALLERNEDYDADVSIEIDGRRNVYLSKVIKRKKKRKRKYDRRTFSYLTLAFGINNAIIEGESLNDSPYEVGGSRFFEIGWTWDTRVFKNSNFLRLKYGYSFQFNGLRQRENVIFVEDGNVTRVEPFPFDLRKSKLTNSNIVFPIHFEFGASKKIERENYFRYSTRKKFRVAVGGYAGFNIGTRQRLRFRDENGNRQRQRIRGDFNVNDFVYGLSSYIGFGSTSLYFKYDLSPIFRNQEIDQNNISLGLRLEL